jgi:ubiquitin-activating enzyme E1
MDFIAAAANIRAMNFELEPQDPFAIKKTVGNIIPAIATTTAMVCGFVAFELYKVHALVPKRLEDFRFATVNLAINMYSFSEPQACPKFVCPANGLEYSMWTTWVIEGDLSLGEFLSVVKKKYKLHIEMLSVGDILVYSPFDPSRTKARLPRKLTQILVEEFRFLPLAPGQNLLYFIAVCLDEDGNDIDTPPIALKVK